MNAKLLWCSGLSIILAIALMLAANGGRLSAAPESGSVLTVNTSNDSYTQGDSSLSLREAMSIANGSLVGPFSVAERAQMTGCTFDASGNITSGCGAGGDTIKFTQTLTQVLLTSRPPMINKTGDVVDGAVNAGRVIVNGQGLADYGFSVAASHVTIKNVTVINIGNFGAAVSLGNGNWKQLEVANSYLGILPGAATCSDPRIVVGPFFDVIIFGGSGTGAAGDGTAYLHDNVIGCSRNDGVAISNAPYVYIGVAPSGTPGRNWIGINPSGNALPNAGSGVSMCCTGGTQGNTVMTNTIGYNGGDGISLAYVSNDAVGGNDIHHNGLTGMSVVSSTLISMSNNTVHDNNSSGIWLKYGDSNQNTITGGAYYNNGAAGITEGEGAYENTWSQVSTYQNSGLGIDKNDNGLPDATGAVSITGAMKTSNGISVAGTYSGGWQLGRYHVVELYRAAPDPSGYGEGRTYVGHVIVNDVLLGPPPIWSILDPNACGNMTYTAMITDYNVFATPPPTSYEFSKNLSINAPCTLMLPLIEK